MKKEGLFISTIKQNILKIYNVAFHPTRFFKTVENEPFLTTLLFFLILSGIIAIITFPVNYFTFQQATAGMIAEIEGATYGTVIALASLGQYIIKIAGLLFVTLILHLAVKIMKGQPSYAQSFKVFVYSFAPILVASIALDYFFLNPILLLVSMIISLGLFVYQLYLMVIGIRDLHKLSTNRAIKTLLLFILFVIILAAILGIVMLLTALGLQSIGAMAY
ncbi:YIP1 family protein [Candidatus Woesearchaeota archaeon]|nr:YIP1 family protein [Candidatus Woesearchaeota archaeon]